MISPCDPGSSTVQVNPEVRPIGRQETPVGRQRFNYRSSRCPQSIGLRRTSYTKKYLSACSRLYVDNKPRQDDQILTETKEHSTGTAMSVLLSTQLYDRTRRTLQSTAPCTGNSETIEFRRLQRCTLGAGLHISEAPYLDHASRGAIDSGISPSPVNKPSYREQGGLSFR